MAKDIDNIDKKILNYIQKTFPVVEEPFRVIGEEVGITEEEALGRVKRMVDTGLIRRIGGVFDTKKMGFVSTLVAASVPEAKLADFVEMVNSLKGVTHNYRRAHAYNVWFTLIAPTEDELRQNLAAIEEKTGVKDILNLRSVRTFKIDARFEFD